MFSLDSFMLICRRLQHDVVSFTVIFLGLPSFGGEKLRNRTRCFPILFETYGPVTLSFVLSISRLYLEPYRLWLSCGFVRLNF